MSHHQINSEHMERFLGQISGTARREYPAGRMGAEDDGAIVYAMATDQRHRTIIIRYGKPVEWVAMGLKEAEELRDQLTDRILSLRGIENLSDGINKLNAELSAADKPAP